MDLPVRPESMQFGSAGDNNVLPGFPHSVFSLYFVSLLFCFRSFLIFLKKYKQKTKASGLGVVNFIQKPFDSTTIFER